MRLTFPEIYHLKSFNWVEALLSKDNSPVLDVFGLVRLDLATIDETLADPGNAPARSDAARFGEEQ